MVSFSLEVAVGQYVLLRANGIHPLPLGQLFYPSSHWRVAAVCQQGGHEDRVLYGSGVGVWPWPLGFEGILGICILRGPFCPLPGPVLPKRFWEAQGVPSNARELGRGEAVNRALNCPDERTARQCSLWTRQSPTRTGLEECGCWQGRPEVCPVRCPTPHLGQHQAHAGSLTDLWPVEVGCSDAPSWWQCPLL